MPPRNQPSSSAKKPQSSASKSEPATTAPTLHSSAAGATQPAVGADRGKRRRGKRGRDTQDDAQTHTLASPAPLAAASTSTVPAPVLEIRRQKKRKGKKKNLEARAVAGTSTAPLQVLAAREPTPPPRLKSTPDCFKVPRHRGGGAAKAEVAISQFERSKVDLVPAQREPPSSSPEVSGAATAVRASSSASGAPEDVPAPAVQSSADGPPEPEPAPATVVPDSVPPPHHEQGSASDMEISMFSDRNSRPHTVSDSEDSALMPVPPATAKFGFPPKNKLGLFMDKPSLTNTWSGISFPSWHPRAFLRVTSCTVPKVVPSPGCVRRTKSLPLMSPVLYSFFPPHVLFFMKTSPPFQKRATSKPDGHAGEHQIEPTAWAAGSAAASGEPTHNSAATPRSSAMHGNEARLVWSPGAGKWRAKFPPSPGASTPQVDAVQGDKQTDSGTRSRRARARRKRSRAQRLEAPRFNPPPMPKAPACQWNAWQHSGGLGDWAALYPAQASKYWAGKHSYALAALNAFLVMQSPVFSYMAPADMSRTAVIAHSVLRNRPNALQACVHAPNKHNPDQEQLPQHSSTETKMTLDDTWSCIVFRTDGARNDIAHIHGIQHTSVQEHSHEDIFRRLGGILEIEVQQKKRTLRRRRMTASGRLD